VNCSVAVGTALPGRVSVGTRVNGGLVTVKRRVAVGVGIGRLGSYNARATKPMQ
jgi:hypothetical protein